MLGILIPGVREVRAPLVAGTLMLVSAYLLLFDSADSVFAEDQVSPGLQSIYDVLGSNGLLVAGAVAAYLLGTVVTRLVSRRMQGVQLALVPKVASADYRTATKKPRLLAFCAPFSRPSLARVCGLCERQAVSAEAVLGEIVVSGGKRLLVVNRDLYSDYDRYQSEAEFRLAVIGPVLLLSVAVALQVPALFAVELGAVVLVHVLCFFIVGDALAIIRQANSMYAHAVVDGVVSTPTLDTDTTAPPAAEAD